MKQPLVSLALLYVAGVVVGHFVEAPLLPAFAAALGLALGALRISAARLWLAATALFLLGWLNLTSRMAIVSPNDLRSVLTERMSLVSVRGRLAESPSERVFLRNGAEQVHTLARIEVELVRAPGGDWQPAFGRLMSRTPGGLPETFVARQSVEVTGIAVQPQPPVAEGVFDYARYLRSHRIYHELKIESASDWHLSGAQVKPPMSEQFRAWARRTLARGLPPDESLRLQWAMLLGWQTALTSEVSEPFMRSGTMHIFAISGLHIALIAGIFLILFRALMAPRLASGLAVIGIIWFYTCATGWQPSAIRSTVMMTVIIAGWMLERPSKLLNSLAVAAFIILVWQPEQLFQASFQLSFFVVFSLALLAGPMERLRERSLRLDPLLPWELRPWWQRQAINLRDWAWTGIATSLAAFIGSVPLIAYYFHLFTPGSLIANVIVVPISALALMSGLGALITGDLLPFVTEWFNHSGWFFMHLMIWFSERAAEMPAGWRHVPGPTPILFLLYYGLLVAGCTGWFARRTLRWAAISIWAVLAVTAFVQWQHGRTWHRLTVLPLNGAHAVAVQPARGGSEWLINCGDRGAVEFTIKPFWQAQGGNGIDNLLLTHGDSRFVSGAVPLHELFPVRDTWVSTVPARSPHYREVLSDLELRSRVHRTATNGFALKHWRVLHPNATDRFPNAADNSVVALGDFDGVRVLLVANLDRAGQNAVFTRHPDLRPDILINGVSGTDAPLASDWLDVLRPRLIVVADSESPSRRLGPTALAQMRRMGAEVIACHSAGAVTLSIRDSKWRVKTARPIGFELETAAGPTRADMP